MFQELEKCTSNLRSELCSPREESGDIEALVESVFHATVTCREIVPHHSMHEHARYAPCSDAYTDNLRPARLFAAPGHLRNMQDGACELTYVFFKNDSN